jgi:two-component system chemotaxis response regulator CheB
MPSDPTTTAVVVDDSNFMRIVIGDILESGGIEVVATASDGAEAVRVVQQHDPDVVTMDVEMPGVGGIEAVERIMATHPTPILMLSAHTEEGASVTFEAIDRGAVDFFTKPGGEISAGMARFEEQLVEQVRSVAQSSVGPDGVRSSPGDVRTEIPAVDFEANPTLVVGASNGGPHAVERLLSDLPLAADFRVLVVQHMPEGFTERFAERLDAVSDYAVREAEHRASVGGGEAVVARGGHHLVASGYRRGRVELELTDDPPRHGVRPAIDVTLESVAATVDDPVVAVVLTGMGRDGAAGVERVKAAGGFVVAQDEATSAVFGMPKQAIETGCVDTVEPLAGIPRAVVQSISREAAA